MSQHMPIEPILTPIEHTAVVVANEALAPDLVLLTLSAPAIAAAAVPGQFVHIACNRFLRRPFGIAGVDLINGHLRVGIQVKGEGTRDLASRQPGASLSVLGPLGNGFMLDDIDAIIAVAGGTGLFPLTYLLEHAAAHGIQAAAFCGYRSAAHAFLTDVVAASTQHAVYASERGDLDFHGTCVDALCAATVPVDGAAGCRLGSQTFDPARTLLAAVGPMPMMNAARLQAARLGMPCQVSLEERMACGIGVCLVCACKTRTDDPAQPYHASRCCVDGPVFRAEEILWE